MRNITVTGGNEAAYIDKELRSKLWTLASHVKVGRGAIINAALRAYFDLLGVKELLKEGKGP